MNCGDKCSDGCRPDEPRGPPAGVCSFLYPPPQTNHLQIFNKKKKIKVYFQEDNWKVGGGVKVRLWCWLLRCVCHIPFRHTGGRKILHRLRKRERKVETDVRWFMNPGIQRRDFSSLDFFWFIWKSTLSGWFRGDKRLYLTWSSQQSQPTTSKGATQLKNDNLLQEVSEMVGHGRGTRPHLNNLLEFGAQVKNSFGSWFIFFFLSFIPEIFA